MEEWEQIVALMEKEFDAVTFEDSCIVKFPVKGGEKKTVILQYFSTSDFHWLRVSSSIAPVKGINALELLRFVADEYFINSVSVQKTPGGSEVLALTNSIILGDVSYTELFMPMSIIANFANEIEKKTIPIAKRALEEAEEEME